MNKPYTVRLEDKNTEQFKKLYPKMLGKYLDCCISLALKNKDLFLKILFQELK